MVASEIFRREGLRRRIASRIQYALPVVQKPSRENRPTGVRYLECEHGNRDYDLTQLGLNG